MKADFNIIGERIDAATEEEDRSADMAPYCNWYEITEMLVSGTLNMSSHSYRMHRYNNDGRCGANLKDGETEAEYAEAVQHDYALMVSCYTGWTGGRLTSFAYPYSVRSEVSDRGLLSNTGYQLLMGGNNARCTLANYFLNGAPCDSYPALLTRQVRNNDHTAADLIEMIVKNDASNGVN